MSRTFEYRGSVLTSCRSTLAFLPRRFPRRTAPQGVVTTLSRPVVRSEQQYLSAYDLTCRFGRVIMGPAAGYSGSIWVALIWRSHCSCLMRPSSISGVAGID
jgi:hypothetical protein